MIDPNMMAQLAMMAMQMQQQGSQATFGAGTALGSGGDWAGSLAQHPGVGMIPGASLGLGFLSGKKQKKQQKKLRKRIEQQRTATQSIFGKGLGQQEAMARQATQQRLGGFETAKKAAELAASGAKRGVQQRGLQTQASLAQGLTNRGLGSTSVGANLGRGVAADTSGQFADIDEALGQYFGNLAMGRAGIEAQGTETLADLASQRSNFDIQNANFWSPYNWQRLGATDARMAGGGMGMGGGGGGGFDPAMLAQLFQGQG